MDIEEVAEKTYRIEIFDQRIESLFAIYFINEGEGVLIEPGPASMIPHIQEALKQLGMTELGFIIPTHIHIDHSNCLEVLVLKGKTGDIQKLADKIKSIKGIKHGELVITKSSI